MKKKNKKILILGGLGFIGKNLYHSLVKDHYDVSILAENVNDIEDGFLNPEVQNKIIVGNILDKDFIENAVIGYDVIFSLAGRSGASDSIKDPYHDLDTNLKGHLNVLEACRKNNPRTLLIFPSSRLVYGKPQMNPVDENHILRPESIYAIHKLTTEHYYLLYKELYNINCIIFRVSNPYGPYQQFGSHKYGILNWFIYKAIHKEEIEIYGDGNQKRDFIFIDDLTYLFKHSIDNESLYGNIYNVGYGKGIALKDTAEIIASHIPGTKIKFKEWPIIDKMIETGDYISDIRLLKTKTGWEPQTNFEDGMKETIKFYEKRSR